MNKRFRDSRSGANHICKECDNAYAREYRRKNAEKHKAYYQEWRAANKEKLSQQAKDRRAKLKPDELKKLRRHEADRKKRNIEVLRQAAYAAYGGFKCACCGETEELFLTIDHMDNDGNKHRKEIGSGAQRLYAWLRNNGYPDGFQVLCMNCNMGKHRNGGICPHQTRCNDYPDREYTQASGSAARPERAMI